MKYSSSKKGFTLIELLVVIGIIGLLASVVLANLVQAKAKARDAVRLASLRQMENALDLFYSENGHFPMTSVPSDFSCTNGTGGWRIGGFKTDTQSWIPGLAPKFISQLPVDPLAGSTAICGSVFPSFPTTVYYYKSCDGENYSLIYYCAMESPVTSNDQFYDPSRYYHTLKLCRGNLGCNVGGQSNGIY